MAATPSALTHLECVLCNTHSDPERPANLCWCGGILFARYDLARAARTFSRSTLGRRRARGWLRNALAPP